MSMVPLSLNLKRQAEPEDNEKRPDSVCLILHGSIYGTLEAITRQRRKLCFLFFSKVIQHPEWSCGWPCLDRVFHGLILETKFVQKGARPIFSSPLGLRGDISAVKRASEALTRVDWAPNLLALQFSSSIIVLAGAPSAFPNFRA